MQIWRSTIDQLVEILISEGRRIVDEFGLAARQGKGTPQEVADFREHVLQDFLGRFFPQNYVISKGKITDLEGSQSASIDCLILNPAHPHLIDAKGKFRLIFADGCDAAIEVKPDLARLDELHRALEQCITVKATRRSKTAIILSKRASAHIIEHSLHVPFFIFTLKAFEPSKLYADIKSYYEANATPIEHQIDGLCVHNVGMLKCSRPRSLSILRPQ